MTALRVLVVDDHELVRRGLVAILDRRDGLEVAGQAGTAVEAALRLVPDLVVMDVRLSDGSGIEATREIRAAHPEISNLVAKLNLQRRAQAAAFVAHPRLPRVE